MGLTHVTVALKGFGTSNGSCEADFLVDTGATDCLASASELKKIGVREIGRTAYELSNGRVEEYSFGVDRQASELIARSHYARVRKSCQD